MVVKLLICDFKTRESYGSCVCFVLIKFLNTTPSYFNKFIVQYITISWSIITPNHGTFLLNSWLPLQKDSNFVQFTIKKHQLNIKIVRTRELNVTLIFIKRDSQNKISHF